jgi:hypothetical protein
MKSLRRSFAALAAISILAVAAFAADPSGTYKWSTPGRGGGQPREATLTLAMKDGKLTGTVSQQGRNGPMETEISNAMVKGDDVSFEIAREFNGNKFVTKYSGKLSDDSIKGTMVSPGRNGGEPRTTDWEAKKAK